MVSPEHKLRFTPQIAQSFIAFVEEKGLAIEPHIPGYKGTAVENPTTASAPTHELVGFVKTNFSGAPILSSVNDGIGAHALSKIFGDEVVMGIDATSQPETVKFNYQYLQGIAQGKKIDHDFGQAAGLAN